MKFIEIQGGISTPIFEEELNLYNKILEKGKMFKKDLSEREREVAKYLTSRGILHRLKEDEKVLYKLSSIDEDIWGL